MYVVHCIYYADSTIPSSLIYVARRELKRIVIIIIIINVSRSSGILLGTSRNDSNESRGKSPLDVGDQAKDAAARYRQRRANNR